MQYVCVMCAFSDLYHLLRRHELRLVGPVADVEIRDPVYEVEDEEAEGEDDAGVGVDGRRVNAAFLPRHPPDAAARRSDHQRVGVEDDGRVCVVAVVRARPQVALRVRHLHRREPHLLQRDRATSVRIHGGNYMEQNDNDNTFIWYSAISIIDIYIYIYIYIYNSIILYIYIIYIYI